MNSKKYISFMIYDNASKLGLPPAVIECMIDVESSRNCYAWRHESHYRWLWNVETQSPFRTLTKAEIRSSKAPADFPSQRGSQDTEWTGQRSSWGLMQVMGSTAREHGFKHNFSQLCNPEQGIQWGCKHLKWLYDRHWEKHGWQGIISSYNQGVPLKNDDGTWANQSYVDKVFNRVNKMDIKL